MNRPTLAALGVVTLFACGAKLVTIRVSGDTSTVVEQGTLVEQFIDSFGFGEFVDMDVTQSAELQNEGVEPGDIKDARMTLFELEAVDPAGADLSFLNTVDLYVEADGLPRARIATADDFPVGEPLVEFDLPDVDLTDYIVSEAMTLSTEVDGSRPDEDTEVVARYRIAVGVTGNAACSGGE